MTKFIVSGVCLALLGGAFYLAYSEVGESTYSDIKGDEYVIFFRTAAWLDESSQEWQVPIHGWIYEPEDSTARKAVFEKVLEEQYELVPTAETRENFTNRINLMIADNERGKTIVVDLAGSNHVLPPSTPNGHFETTISISTPELERYADGNVIHYSAVTAHTESRKFHGEVRLVHTGGLSVISDIDDTVKISNVTDHKSLLDHTFLREFSAAPGMPDLYKQWAEHDVNFHFVSSSPWQLYSPLTDFLDSEGFPWATLSLKSVRFRDETLFNLFKKGTETKPTQIERILNRYPDRQFVLVGDSGEQDPEVYAAIMQKYPQQIAHIYIRNVTRESIDNSRFAGLFATIEPDRWTLFDHPHDLQFPVH